MNDYSTYEKRLAEIRMKGMELRAEELELRFNPYHDPQNGRFTTANGGGSGGGFLYSKGGKSAYVFERDIDSEYEAWAKAKAAKSAKTISGKETINVIAKGSDIYNTKYATPDDYKKALAEKYNGITDVSKIKTARDVSDFINYDTQSQYYASYGSKREIESTWNKSRYGKEQQGEISPARDAGFSSKGTTVIDMPKGYSRSGKIYSNSIAKLESAGIGVGTWHDDVYMVTKKPRTRVSKWLEGTSK